MYTHYSIMFGHNFFLNVVHNHALDWFGLSSTQAQTEKLHWTESSPSISTFI